LKIMQLEKENQQLKEYIQVLEYPGTTSLLLIIKYPSMKASSSEEKPKTRPKAFKFGNLVTSEAITKEV
ncbi:666_t:CDS:1, partial [Dentiscutata erythropus]